VTPNGASRPMVLLHPRSVLAVTLTAFVALAIAAALIGNFGVDKLVSDAMLSRASPTMLMFVRVVNMAGEWQLLLPGTVVLFIAFPETRKRWPIWLALMVAAAIAPDLLKHLVERPRPRGHAYGFPSGHATAAAAYFGAVIYLAASLRPPVRRLVRVAAIVMIVLVAIARIMLHAHWPSDTVGGIAFGLALASGAALLAATSPSSSSEARSTSPSSDARS
jgi:membrane-associated phospholipid phosphatase